MSMLTNCVRVSRQLHPSKGHLAGFVVLALILLFVTHPASVYAQYSGAETLTAPTVEQEGGYGRDVASVGDVTGDGTPDLVVGAPGTCGAYLVNGADGSLVHTLDPEWCTVTAVDGIGDVNGDGTPDVILGVEGSNVVYLMSGADGSEIRALQWPGDGSSLFGGRFGGEVAAAGDVDGDGTPDVLVGANNEEVDGEAAAGRAYVMSGADGSVIHTLESPNAQQNGYFGNAVAGVGDISGDGTPDVVVGATNEHSAYFISGADGSVIETIGADTYSGFLGDAVAGIPDVNGDNVPDVLIGAPGEDAYGIDQAGRVYLVSGADGSTIRTFASPNATKRGDFGHDVAALDDANDDGTPDVLVGALRESVDGTFQAGRAYAFSGSNGYILGTLSSQNVEEGGEFGYAVAGLGDLGNGGAPEVVIGARVETVNGMSEAGRAYVYSSDSPLSGTAPPPPIATPSSLTATVVQGPDAELSWDTVSSSSLDEYRIYRSTDPITGEPAGKSPIGTVGSSETSYTDQGGTEGEVYYYRVTAATSAGEESDFSNEVSSFLYPQRVEGTVSRAFGDAADSTEYRLVALPGQVERPLGDAISGEAGTDWQAYRDDGSDSDYLQKYDGSEAFAFEPGTGFWMTAASEWTFEEAISTVELRGDSATVVPLREGWNVISNPLDTDVDWTSVEAATDVGLQPIWAFNGTFESTETFASAADGEAYYFLNDAGLDSLVVSYPGAPGGTKTKENTTSKEASLLRIAAAPVEGEGPSGSTIAVGVGQEAVAGAGPKGVVAPPGRFEAVSLRIEAEDPSSERHRFLMRSRRSIEGEGRVFDLRLTSRTQGPVALTARSLEAVAGREVRLIDASEGRSYDLREQSEIRVDPSEGEALDLQLAVGTEAFVGQQAESMVPEEVALTSYPNPVREQGTLEYALPESGKVSLRVYDVLGREVVTLVEGRKEAGRHVVRLETEGLSSGVYFGRLEAEEQRLTQKITVVR